MSCRAVSSWVSCGCDHVSLACSRQRKGESAHEGLCDPWVSPITGGSRPLCLQGGCCSLDTVFCLLSVASTPSAHAAGSCAALLRRCGSPHPAPHRSNTPPIPLMHEQHPSHALDARLLTACIACVSSDPPFRPCRPQPGLCRATQDPAPGARSFVCVCVGCPRHTCPISRLFSFTPPSCRLFSANDVPPQVVSHPW